ncbi:MAG TPA: pyridoxal-phosphate dependent enzyme [Mycobacteriales bacterium]|nr:pyridoxal-phosphate dependent enzyme [Mycobacteriales bacterium]
MTQPALVSIDEMRAAAERIAPYLHRTPMMTSTSLAEECGTRLALKAELFQRTGSFKARGVVNTVLQLTPEELARGVVTMSAGNHAAALAHAARTVGTSAVVVMPAHAATSKVAAVRRYGAEVVLTAESLLDTMRAIQQERDLVLVHPFDDPRVIAGAGTVGLEIAEDVPDVDVVVVPVGGGGLIAGVAAAVRGIHPGARVVGVEPAGADGMTRALAAAAVVPVERPMSVADGLTAPFAGIHTLAHVQALVEQVVVVSDDEIVAATRLVYQRAKLAVEPAAAAGIAALLRGGLAAAGDRTVCVLTGGNVDDAVIARVFAPS